MKILFIITALGIGGAEKMMLDVCPEIVKNGAEIKVIYLKPLVDFIPELERSGIFPVFVNYDKLGFFGARKEIKKIIKEFTPDIVHTHLPLADILGRFAGLFSKASGIIATIHNPDEWKKSKKLKDRILKLFNRFSVNCFSKVMLVSVSDFVRNYCIKHEKIKPNKIKTIYNFINISPDLSAYPAKDSNVFTVLNVGRLESQKSQITLLKAANLLINHENRHTFRFIIVGDGSLRFELQKYIDSNNLNAYVTLAGHQNDVKSFLAGADVFVLTSLYEGFCLSIFEAFICNVPVIATEIPTMTELVRGTRGIMVPCEDEKILSDKIIQVADKKIDTSEMCQNAQEFALSLNLKTHVEELMSLYQKMVKRRSL